MIIWSLLILIWTDAFEASHFNGGTITWVPLDPTNPSSTVSISIIQTYSWTFSKISCTTNVPISAGGLYANTNTNLTCIGNCTTQGGYPSKLINILTDCISFSTSLNIMTSQRSHNLTLTENTNFWVAYQGSGWIALANGPSSSGSWSIASLIDLIRRPDGLINTPPTSQVTSPQYIIVNRTTTITIPVSDVNTGDDLRCRWSAKNSLSGVNECADICFNTSMTSLGNLTECTLTFTALNSGVWYGIALQLEDFINTTSTVPMSSVPVQFLIYVLPTPNCSFIPVIIPLTNCLEVQVNILVTFTLYVMNYCNRTNTFITDLITTTGITGLQVSNLVNSTTNTSLSYVTLTWTPQINQIGSQQLCAIAYTNVKIQSDSYCVTFIVTTSQPCATTTSTVIPGTNTDTTSTTSITISQTTTTSTVIPGTTTETTSTTSSTISQTTTTTSTTDIITSTNTLTSATSQTTTPATSTQTSSATGTITTTSISTSPSSTTAASTTSAIIATATTAQESVTVTVTVPVSTENISELIGLAVGLGLPLLLCCVGVAIYGCCETQCASLGKHDSRVDNSVGSNDQFEGDTYDYRHQYRKQGNGDQIKNQSILTNDKRTLRQDNSFPRVSVPDRQLNTLNVTKTSLFSPLIHTLPNGDVQYTKETKQYSSATNKQRPKGSILVRGYSERTKHKPHDS